MHISLRSGEKIYRNGAVVRVDRKVSIELLNDVTFLLEAHVMQPQDTNTPLRQLYFVVQTMLIDPAGLDKLVPRLDGRTLRPSYACRHGEELRSILRRGFEG